MIEIIPAVLPVDFEEVREKAGLVAGRVPLMQLDVCDGRFVPSRSWPYTGTDPHHDRFFKKIIEQNEGLPHWQKLNYEIDAMVAEPTRAFVDDWIIAGAARIILHLESTSPHSLKEIIQHILGRLDSSAFLEIGLALGLETPLDAVSEYLEDIDVVQFMGIECVGYQGQEFAGERVLERVRTFHAAHPEIPISVDGGVNPEHARVLVEAGASRLIVGSAIFGNPVTDRVSAEFSSLTETSVSTALAKFKEIL